MLPSLLIFYILGVWAATYLSPAPLTLYLPWLCALAIFGLRRRAPNLLLAGFFFTLGLALANLALGDLSDRTHITSELDGRETLLLGKITHLSHYDSGQLSLDLDQLRVLRQGQSVPLLGKIRLTVDNARQDYLAGSWVQFRAKLKKPSLYGTPGEFNRPLYLASQGIFATASLKNDRGILVLQPTSAALGWEVRLQRTRDSLIDRLTTHHPGLTGKLLRALLLGDKGGLDQDLRMQLSRSGLAHLFSVSGLHLGLVAGLLYLGGACLYRRSSSLSNWLPAGRIVPLLTLPCLWCYMILSGSAVATQRAFLMAAICAVLLLVRRRTSALALLAAVAFMLLLIQPLSLFSPAFQLSLAGLGGIIYLLPKWLRHLPELPNPWLWPLKVFLATLAATLCTFPFTLLYFHQVSAVGPLLNLLAIPAIGLAALPVGLLGLVLVGCGFSSAELLISCSGWLLETIIKLARWVLEIPLFAGTTWYPDPLQMLALLALIGLLLVPDCAGRHKVSLQAVCLALAGLLWIIPNDASPKLKLTSVSVGQGEATLISINGSCHYLIDGGGFYDSAFDVGSRLLAPALGQLGVHGLELAVLSHNHPDHSLGLAASLAASPGTSLLTAVDAEQLPAELATLVERRLIKPVPGWQTLAEADNWQLRLFSPDQTTDNLNDRSLVLYARFENDGVLLTGDLEQDGVRQLLANPPVGPITLLKLPHHGSLHSDTDRLLAAFQPRFAFVSAGRNNPFGLPHPKLVGQLAAASTTLYRTDQDGSVQFQTSGHGWQAKTYTNWLFR